MAGEDEVLRIENGLTTKRTVEDNLHAYTNDSGIVAVGDMVYQVSAVDDKVAISDADDAGTLPSIGVVTQITDATNCIVCHSGGIATGLSGLTRGVSYWLTTTGTTGNTISTTKPATNAYLAGVALSATSLLVSSVPADLAGGGVGGSTGGTDNAVIRADGTGGSTLQASTVIMDDTGNMTGVSSLGMLETASAPTVSAGQGGIWVLNEVPSSPYFTDDTSTDYSLLHYSPTKRPCTLATTADHALTGLTDIDGVTPVAGNRILVWQQTTGSENGIYEAAAGAWSRSGDMNDAIKDHVEAGLDIYIKEGTIYSRTRFVLVTTGTLIIGTTSLEFIGGTPIMRSDAAGTDVIGSSGTPTTLSAADTYFAEAGTTDTRDYRDAVWYARIINKGTATKITLKIEWLEDGSNLGPQGSEGIASGIATLSIYEAEYDISSLTAPFNLPTIALPVVGPNSKVSIKADIGTTATAYVRVWRKV